MINFLLELLENWFGVKSEVIYLDGNFNPIEPDTEELPVLLKYFTYDEYLNGHATLAELDDELKANMQNLLQKVDILRERYGKPLIVNSGYRPFEYNKEIGGAKNSAHVTCQAVDFRDSDGALKDWIARNRNILEELDLYMEHPNYTKTWCHLQIRPTKSGKRVFRP